MFKLTALGVSFAAVMFTVVTMLPSMQTVSYSKEDHLENLNEPNEKKEVTEDNREKVTHEPLPESVKAIYMSSCVAGTPEFRQRLVDLINETEINSVIIDVKDFSGTISFPPASEAWRPAWEAADCGAADMKEFIKELHENNVFVIARITVFQDPFYTAMKPNLAVKKRDGVTVWKDYKGLSFIDVGAREYWDHLILLARDAYNIGFDELNFDYVRYPSDGPMEDISFTHSKEYPGDNKKQANLEEFFRYLHNELSREDLFSEYNHVNTGRDKNIPWTSADLFGMTTTNYDDLSIGQVQDRAAPYFDFIAPMVYPSHYPKNAFGYPNPNDYPYEIVHHAMKSGVGRMKSTTTTMMGFKHERLQSTIATSSAQTQPVLYSKPSYGADKFRTWIQDFDYGGDYDAADVRAQIKASYDAGVMSWMIWAPSNIYTRAALEPNL